MTRLKFVLSAFAGVFCGALTVIVVLALVTLFGCAGPQMPYITSRIVGSSEYRFDYASDGPDIAITVHNPSSASAEVTVRCLSDRLPGPRWVVIVPAGGQVTGLGRVMSRYSLTDPCWVSDIGPL